MTLSLVLAAAALLTGQLPAGHPSVGQDTPSPASSSPRGGLPEGHPSLGGEAGAPGGTPAGPLPEGHPAMTGKAPPSAEELLKQLDGMQGLREREKTFEIAASLGKLYSNNGRPSDAINYYLQAEQKGEAVRELYLAQRKKVGKVASAEEAHCGFTANTSVEEMAKVATERAGKGDGAGAAACARAALEPVLEVQEMRADALVVSGKGEDALKVYESVLEVAPAHADALFGRSALLYELHGEDAKALQAAREGFEAFVAQHASAPRAAMARRLATSVAEAQKAGGMKQWLASRAEDRRIRATKLDLKARPPPMEQGPVAGGGQPMAGNAAGPMAGSAAGPMAGGGSASAPMISQETMQAMQNVEHTPELEAQLTKTVEQGEELLAHGRYDEALQAYRQVMPLRPDARVQAGLAWTLVGLGKPTADRVWSVAVRSDPSAVDKLGETLKAKGDTRGAKALWTKLAASAPDYAASASLQAKLEP